MQKYPLEIIIPIFNEGEQVIKLLNLINEKIKTKFRILLCYDSKEDDIFEYKNNLNNFNFEIKLVQNSGQGPCSAIKEGFKFGNSDCVIVYPADDFINIDILDKMYGEFLNGSEIVVASRYCRPCTLTKVTIRTAVAAVTADIMPGRPPVNAVITAIENEAYKPTLGSTPAIIENAIASGIRASATTSPANESPRMLVNQSFFT